MGLLAPSQGGIERNSAVLLNIVPDQKYYFGPIANKQEVGLLELKFQNKTLAKLATILHILINPEDEFVQDHLSVPSKVIQVFNKSITLFKLNVQLGNSNSYIHCPNHLLTPPRSEHILYINFEF